MFEFHEWRDWPIAQNSATDLLIAGGIFVGMLAILLILRPVVRRHAERMHTSERRELLEIPLQVLSRTTVLFLVSLSLYFALRSLEIGERVTTVINSFITIITFVQFGLWAAAAVHAWIDRRRTTAADRAVVGSLSIISFIAGVLIWALVLLATLDNLGVNITALVAGLGIGGVAVALALQNVLGDLFASLSIALDRPFVVGDFLAIDNFLGSVEYIGIKTTRLRSLDGEQIIISNSDLLKSRVRNYGRMRERRLQFNTRLHYATPVELIERVPKMIRQIVESQKDTRFDRSHFLKHGDSALEFETVYYMLTADYNQYMDVQQSINLQMHRRFAELGIDFAYPVQRVMVLRPAGHDEITEEKLEERPSPAQRAADSPRAGAR